MCDTCGCGQPNDEVIIRKPGEENNKHSEHIHEHEHDGHTHLHKHEQDHEHEHDHYNHTHKKTIELQTDILQKNNLLAERNRGYFQAKNIFSVNLVSSPGSGKTSLLERSIRELKNEMKFFVIEGDQQTMNDANRIEAVGAPVIQINTGNGCHLDADMINKAINKLDAENNSVVMIENVGNLVCPALFDLGETKRVVIISVTEGEDKPIKYPNMFASSHLCIINKTDLLPYVDFDIEKTKQYAHQVNHHLEFIELSVKTGEGMKEWYEWIKTSSKRK
ncbi:MAG: hydrogenase nickel incorporation protein HypB [Melioribacteraceae bacterium]